MGGVGEPAALAATRLFGENAAFLIALAITAAAAGCTSAGIAPGPRIVYALAKDGLFPAPFGRVHPRFQTPSFAIVVQAVWMSLLCLSGRYDQLYTYATFFVILAYAATGIALFVLRRKQPGLARPYRCWGYPVVPLLFVVCTIAARRKHPARAAEGDARGNRHPPARPSRVLRHAPAGARGRLKTRRGAFACSCWPPSRSRRGRPPPPPPSLTGFTPQRSAWQREYEQRLLALPQPAECEEIHREITRAPHIAGTEGNSRVAEYLAAEYKKAGWEVEMPAYDVLLSYPKSAALEIVARSADRSRPGRAADSGGSRTPRCRRPRSPGTPTPPRPKSPARSSTSTTAAPRTTNG